MTATEREMWLEQSAASARSVLFVYDNVPIDLAIALKRLGDLPVTPRASYEVLPDKKMRYDEAYTDGDQKIIYVSDATIRAAQNGSVHHRFTIAHELAHVELNHPGVRSRALHGRDFRVQASISGAAQEEADADFWAGAFLMPLSCVSISRTPEELAARTLTSVTAARIRFERIARRTRLANKQLRPIPMRTQEVLTAFYKEVGVSSRSFTPAPPAEFKEVVRKENALLQGFLAIPCKICGNYELVDEGGCTTCKKCGDSNCC